MSPYSWPKKVAVVVSNYHEQITDLLTKAAIDELSRKDVAVVQINVPGAFELPYAIAASIDQVDAAIAIGCIVKGETDHYEHLASACTHQLCQISVNAQKPVGLAVLTVDDLDQAAARAGGAFGNKGREAALAVLQAWHNVHQLQ